ncbi:MAG: hypothetical protein KDK71_10090 [Chlamydiia bacterium]|nr:hypothetical protein [Chlamydiia bacterium]
MLPLCADDSFYHSGRIGDRFYQPPKQEKDALKVSGELLFFGEGVGYLPERCTYSPGFRLSLETLPFYKSLEIGAHYTHWGREFENSFKIPVMKVTRTIANDYDFDAAELTIGRSLPTSSRFTLKPGVGIAWEQTIRETKIYELWKITQRSTSLGPLVALDFETKLLNTLYFNTHLSAAYLQTANKEWYDQKLTKKQTSYYHPKSQVGFDIEYRPLPSIRLKAGYEIHYVWTKDIHDKINWNHPSNLQGFKAELSYEY